MTDTPQTWWIARVSVPNNQAEEVTAQLFDLDPNGIEEKTESDDEVVLEAYFDPAAFTVQALESRIRNALPSAEVMVSEMTWDATDDRWRQYFKPFEIVPNIVIAPSWEHYHPQPNQRVIHMDPGMAFGTGLHPTTRMCAEAIYGLNQDHTIHALLDVGCGSGILCLVAHLLEIGSITGVEIDPEAADIARNNVVLNGAGPIEVVENLDAVADSYDLVVANILLNTLIELRDGLIRAIKPGGHLVLSGITDDQEDELKDAFSQAMTHVDTRAADEWRCVILKR